MAVPISALQRNAAEVVRRVAASGVAEEITDRGRVVGLLAPPPLVDGLERLRQSGAIRRAEPGSIAELLAEMADLPSLGLPQALEEQRNTE